jgi:hypothetical protein
MESENMNLIQFRNLIEIYIQDFINEKKLDTHSWMDIEDDFENLLKAFILWIENRPDEEEL